MSWEGSLALGGRWLSNLRVSFGDWHFKVWGLVQGPELVASLTLAEPLIGLGGERGGGFAPLLSGRWDWRPILLFLTLNNFPICKIPMVTALGLTTGLYKY